MIKWQIYSLYTRLGFLILYLAMKSSFTLLQTCSEQGLHNVPDLIYTFPMLALREYIYIYLKIDACGGNLYAWVATFHINEDWCFTFSQKKWCFTCVWEQIQYPHKASEDFWQGSQVLYSLHSISCVQVCSTDALCFRFERHKVRIVEARRQAVFEVEARVLASRRRLAELESMHAEGERMKAATQELDNLKRVHSCLMKITRVWAANLLTDN